MAYLQPRNTDRALIFLKRAKMMSEQVPIEEHK